MSTEGGNKAIIAALSANLGIGATKFVAFGLTGASSMLAEAIHSVADSGNQVLLLVGGKQAKRLEDNQHPFGYSRSRYYYAFLVPGTSSNIQSRSSPGNGCPSQCCLSPLCSRDSRCGPP